jgi:ABC-type multidrug transport system fused ATPase/permease subunit
MIDTLKAVYSLLTKADRLRLALVGLVTLLSAVGEVIGVSSITPFIAVLSRPSLISENAQLQWAYTTLEFSSQQGFLLSLGALFLLLLVLSLALRGVSAWAQWKFANGQARSWSSRLLSAYLRQPYQWFLTKHSSELGSAILSEVDNVVWNALVPAIVIAAQSLVAALLLLLLFWADPQLAAGAMLFVGIAYAALNSVVKNRLRELGDERWRSERERYRVISEALGGVKEVKLFRLEPAFIRRFEGFAEVRAARMTTSSVLSQIPSLAMQGLLFGGMMMSLLYLVATRGTLGDALPVIGVYALAGYRMMPAIQRIFEESAKLRGAETMVESLVRTVRQLESNILEKGGSGSLSVGRTSPAASLVIENVVFQYEGAEAPALKDVSLTVSLGTSVGIVGASGSGKSTLVDVILGLLRPQHGKVEIRGAKEEGGAAAVPHIGYIPQQIFLADDTIGANIAFGLPRHERDEGAILEAARLARLDDFVKTLPDGYETSVGERGVKLSGGQRQRIGIARALYRSPAIVIMDEATSALDNLTEAEVMEGMRALGQGRTLVMVAHRLSTVRHCDEIFVMENGTITASGRYDELVESSSYFARLAGTA